MNITPRHLLASGTALAAVAGALLLGAEGAGRASFAPEHAADVTAGLWMPAPRVVAPASLKRSPAERARVAAR